MEYEGNTAALERPSDIEKNPAGVVRRWLLELKLADKRESEWRKKSEKVLKRYRQEEAKKHSFNILWSNTETLRPAVYNSLPKPDVRRRFKDEDPIGKACAEVLSRSIEYGLDTTDFNSQITFSVLDMLLPGRGVARVRYVPSLTQVGEPEEAEIHEPAGENLQGETEELQWEQCPIEHVSWDDFRIGPGKEWSEIPWIAFRHRLTREELEAQFPECGSEVELDAVDDLDVKAEDDGVQNAFKTAEVWEIWHKEDKKVLFVATGYKAKPMKEVDDPLNLIDFWPVPRPLYAIEDGTSMVPIPLYEMYKEQADELDTITRRLNIITRGLKLRGVYDSTISEISQVMRGEDNDLIPASNVTALLERGGLEKAIWMMPIDQAAQVLVILTQQRESVKQIIYEITGISDILRGSSNAAETATAQQIKAQWGSNRLKKMQAEVARFVRDLIRIQAEIIGEKFQPETLMTMTGIKLPSAQEKQQAMMAYQQKAAMAQQQGQQPPPPPENIPSWEEVIQVLRDDKLRTFKVDVETDSTVAASIETDMNALRDVLTSVVQLVQGFGPAVQMGAMPIEAVKEMILAVTRRAKLGNAVEDALDKIKQPEPQSQPEDKSDQVEQIKQQGQAQLKQMELAHSAQLEQFKEQQTTERERIKAEYQSQSEAQRIEFDRWKAELDNQTKIIVANIQSQTSLQSQQMGLDAQADTVDQDGTKKPTKGVQMAAESVGQQVNELVSGIAEKLEGLFQAHQDMSDRMEKSQVVSIRRVRDANGKLVGGVKVLADGTEVPIQIQ